MKPESSSHILQRSKFALILTKISPHHASYVLKIYFNIYFLSTSWPSKALFPSDFSTKPFAHKPLECTVHSVKSFADLELGQAR